MDADYSGDGFGRYRTLSHRRILAERFVSRTARHGFSAGDVHAQEVRGAEQAYAAIAEQHAATVVVPEAIYWRGVCHYKATNDHTVLGEVAKELAEKHPGDEWTLKSVPWAH